MSVSSCIINYYTCTCLNTTCISITNSYYSACYLLQMLLTCRYSTVQLVICLFHYISTMFFHLFIEPSGFPQNLTATTINSTAITVSWEEVLVIETNGIITHYNIIGMPDATFSVPTVEEIVDNSTFSIQFNHLEEFVIYRFTISARTVIGFGPRSPEESAQTDEAGNSIVCTIQAMKSIHLSVCLSVCASHS